MATAPRSFRRTVMKRAEERPVVTFTLDWVSDTEVDDEGNALIIRSDTFHARKPTEERIFIVAAVASSEESSSSEAGVVLDLLHDILPVDEFSILRSRMLDPDDDVNLSMIQDVIVWLMGEWASFPTQQQSDSVELPNSTGTTSTGRAPGPGSTRSTSPSTAS